MVLIALENNKKINKYLFNRIFGTPKNIANQLQ